VCVRVLLKGLGDWTRVIPKSWDHILLRNPGRASRAASSQLGNRQGQESNPQGGAITRADKGRWWAYPSKDGGGSWLVHWPQSRCAMLSPETPERSDAVISVGRRRVKGKRKRPLVGWSQTNSPTYLNRPAGGNGNIQPQMRESFDGEHWCQYQCVESQNFYRPSRCNGSVVFEICWWATMAICRARDFEILRSIQ
jgi:hypothetical protein